ncbi:electron transfer flavoprotein alpha subunit [Haloarcula marismortui ATCC 43049]|uniref:Electron transfer flavoprotein alpha subunit n=1 Tax=Haloarcula marismortui (strain ATCC 43049 / DSM 3752 / JCM 8966 / VKM B-1809) TaxID=272569 RepID=Q5V5N3_HALMA|nr:electron transfer flavoprotein subunit alpha/FixB family protein [Haloarcula marismortui]AAV45169.1 electron transfer flavoprotein alpha subunit [Haloarcula marismortui ATCC 43049]QCP92954.1 electron transfer flavoprotein subunit alpha/FixB family protein [Haloarcula marismortui ATCC 43049]
MPDIDPTEHEIAELGPKIKDVDDADELQAMLALEEDGEDRVPVKTLIKDRIEKVESDDDGEIDPEAVDLSDLTVADVANMVRDVDDADVLRDLLEREKAGQDRKTAKSQIESRIESVEGTEEAEGEAVTEVEYVPPEEKYPELDHPTNDKQWVEGTVGAEYRDMWVYCETQAGDLVDVSKEMLGKARELMNDYNAAYDEDERVVAVLIGAAASDHVEDVIAYGADLVVYHEDDRLDRFRHQPYTEIFCDMARAGGDLAADGREETEWKDYHEPRYTVFPATNNGRDLSALVQGELDSGLASDCSGLYIESAMISNPAKVGTAGDKKEFERVLHMKRPDFSGFEYSTILCIDKPHRDFHPQGASVIPGSFEMPDPDYERDGEVVDYGMDIDDDWFTVEVEEYDRLSGGVDLSGHDVIVAVGRGIGDDPTRGIEQALDLVDAFDDADLGLSRGVITSSYSFDGHVEQYVTEERQIGESGQEVEPDVYIAAGISGAIQHKVGCDESDTLIAVNTDPDADIRDFSDYLIEGDLFEVLPRLTEAVETGELGAMMEASDD